MSPRATATASRSPGRTAVTVVMVCAIAVALVFVVKAKPRNEPFDPRSGSDSGTRGLVLLLERYGASVSFGRAVPDAASDARVLVLEDRLDNDQRTEVLDFVEAGGVAIVADPTSTLHGGPGLDGGSIEISHPGAAAGLPPTSLASTVDLGRCTIGALEHLRGLMVESGIAFRVAPTDSTCFGSAGNAMVTARPFGDGTMVALGDNEMLTNRLLAYGDNAGLATALMAPEDGAEVVIVLGDGPRPAGVPDVGSGDDTWVDLVHPSIWMALAQLALAFIVFAVARGIRPGRVVDEPLPTPIAGSELVVAIGNVMHRAGHTDRAASLMRFEAHRRLCADVGLPPQTRIDVLDRAVSRRFGVEPGAVIAALVDNEPGAATDGDLLRLADRLHRITAATRSTAIDKTSTISTDPNPENP